MKISVLGANGQTGQLVVAQLLEQNHDVIAYIRNPDRLTLSHPKLTIIKGEIFDRQAMAQAIAGSDALISCLGSSTTTKSDQLALMAASVIAAIKETNIPKAVYMSTAGIENELHGFMKWLVHAVVGNVIEDHTRAANQYKKSEITYVIARPMRLKNGKSTHKYHMSEEGLPKCKRPISRANVADFLVKAATTTKFDNKSIALSQ